MSQITKSFLEIRSQIERHVRRLVGLQNVDDIVQETFVRSVEAELTSDIQYSRSYLLRTAQNIALNHLEKWDNKYAAPLDDLTSPAGYTADDDSPEHHAHENERFRLFCEAADQLDGNVRKAFILKKVYGQSQREVAEHLGLSESTVEKHVAKGLRHCADFMARREQSNDAPVIAEITEVVSHSHASE